ncbi:transposase domain-containing protein [Ponticoccus sp. (in: a-proteobacteria)]|uniref:transposase domain-containing protein n=1 Tax=Ponticoccus sp. (in: a-proteobacteria) TaxID=1925025 RepID=UPI003AB354A2
MTASVAQGSTPGFLHHALGAIRWRRNPSLVETARINGVEPFAHLNAIAAGHPQGQLDDRAPWNVTPPT